VYIAYKDNYNDCLIYDFQCRVRSLEQKYFLMSFTNKLIYKLEGLCTVSRSNRRRHNYVVDVDKYWQW